MERKESLKDELCKRGLIVSGNKPILIARLEADDDRLLLLEERDAGIKRIIVQSALAGDGIFQLKVQPDDNLELLKKKVNEENVQVINDYLPGDEWICGTKYRVMREQTLTDNCAIKQNMQLVYRHAGIMG